LLNFVARAIKRKRDRERKGDTNSILIIRLKIPDEPNYKRAERNFIFSLFEREFTSVGT